MIVVHKRLGRRLGSSRLTAQRRARALLAASLLALSACVSPSTPVASTSTTIHEGPAPSSAPTTSTSIPTVTVTKGEPVSTPSCTHASCAYIAAATAGFPGEVTCSVDSQMGNEGFVPWTQAAVENRQSPNFYGYPDTTVTVTCTGGGQSASGSITW